MPKLIYQIDFPTFRDCHHFDKDKCSRVGTYPVYSLSCTSNFAKSRNATGDSVNRKASKLRGIAPCATIIFLLGIQEANVLKCCNLSVLEVRSVREEHASSHLALKLFYSSHFVLSSLGFIVPSDLMPTGPGNENLCIFSEAAFTRFMREFYNSLLSFLVRQTEPSSGGNSAIAICLSLLCSPALLRRIIVNFNAIMNWMVFAEEFCSWKLLTHFPWRTKCWKYAAMMLKDGLVVSSLGNLHLFMYMENYAILAECRSVSFLGKNLNSY